MPRSKSNTRSNDSRTSEVSNSSAKYLEYIHLTTASTQPVPLQSPQAVYSTPSTSSSTPTTVITHHHHPTTSTNNTNYSNSKSNRRN